MSSTDRTEEIMRLKSELGIKGSIIVSPTVESLTEDDVWRLSSLMHFFNDVSGVDAQTLESNLQTVRIGDETYFLLDDALFQNSSWDNDYDHRC